MNLKNPGPGNRHKSMTSMGIYQGVKISLEQAAIIDNSFSIAPKGLKA